MLDKPNPELQYTHQILSSEACKAILGPGPNPKAELQALQEFLGTSDLSTHLQLLAIVLLNLSHHTTSQQSTWIPGINIFTWLSFTREGHKILQKEIRLHSAAVFAWNM